MFQLQISLRSKRFRGVGEQRNSKEQDFARKRLLRRLTQNALWHIDSNQKLIRWRLINHVCVHEYSRIIIYAHCCNNNKADTVLGQFVGGMNSYGLPSRVRSDFGMENFKVAEFMLEQRGCDRGSITTGSSVHNFRVERAHRDIYLGVLCLFARTFTLNNLVVYKFVLHRLAGK